MVALIRLSFFSVAPLASPHKAELDPLRSHHTVSHGFELLATLSLPPIDHSYVEGDKDKVTAVLLCEMALMRCSPYSVE